MKQGYRGCDLRVMMGISTELFTIFKNKREHKYKYIAERYDFSHLRNVKQTPREDVVKVCEMLQSGATVMETYKTLKLSRTMVRAIKDRKNYRHISKDYIW